MYIVSAYIDIELPYVHSLKGRRKIIQSIKDRLKNRNISLLDVSQEYPKEATLALCFLSPTKEEAHKKIQQLESVIQKSFPELTFEIVYELL